MSAQAPQVLSRRANGVPPGATSQAADSGKGKNANDNAGSRPGRGRAANEKTSEPSKNRNESEASKPSKTKAQNEGDKLVIRRLPPGMTQTEFESILGPDWELGKGKVDWFSFSPGKVSNDPSKPSRPGRAYFHVMRKDDIMALSETVRIATWEDAKNTFNSPSLAGPPSVEFAIYKKVPSNKKRTDARQGTIDQDPEFMAFLEELANPPAPRDGMDADEGEEMTKTDTKITTTPLVEYLKEKKANKGKDGGSGKNAKHGRHESGAAKGKGAAKEDGHTKKRGKDSKGERSEKTPKETVKILTKKAATEQATEAAKNVASQINSANTQDAPKSRRAGIAAAARLLQRDLGLSPGSAHRRARQDAAKADVGTPAKETAEVASERPVSPAPVAESSSQGQKSRPTTPTAPKAQAPGRRTRGGKNPEKGKSLEGGSSQPSGSASAGVVVLKKKGDAESTRPASSTNASQTSGQGSSSKAGSNAPSATKGASNKSGSSQKKPISVTADATRGFVKHANPSQGISEALLKEALGAFGTITFVEMDKRKGFAYVDFAEHESLVKAVSASPVPVGQGTVQVLERKEKKAPSAAGTSTTTASPAAGSSGSAASEKPSGRGRRGRGGGAKTGGAANGQAAAATSASNGGPG